MWCLSGVTSTTETATSDITADTVVFLDGRTSVVGSVVNMGIGKKNDSVPFSESRTSCAWSRHLGFVVRVGEVIQLLGVFQSGRSVSLA